MRRCTAADLLRCASLSAVAGAMCWYSAGETCGTVHTFLLCVGCSCAQECALWVRGRKILFYRIEKSVLHLCSAQHPCSNPALRAAAAKGDAPYSRFFALALVQNGTIDQRSKTCSALHYSRVPHKRAQRRVVFVSIQKRSNHPCSKKRKTAPQVYQFVYIATLPRTSALRQQQRKEKQHKTSLPQCIPAH